MEQRRGEAIVKAQANLETAQRALNKAKEQAESFLKAHRETSLQLKMAQERATAEAQRVTAARRLALEDARVKLKAAQDQAIADFERNTPQPALPAHVKPEEVYLQYPRVQQLRVEHWGFGTEPGSDGKPSDIVLTAGVGLVTTTPKPMQATQSTTGHETRGSRCTHQMRNSFGVCLQCGSVAVERAASYPAAVASSVTAGRCDMCGRPTRDDIVPGRQWCSWCGVDRGPSPAAIPGKDAH